MNLKRLNQRRTKIVATLGPSSSTPDTIAALVAAGMDVARINGSHGDHASHARTIAHVRAASRAAGRPVCVLFDLQGPKIRIGSIAAPRPVHTGQHIEIAVGRAASGDELPCDYELLDRDVTPGQPLLIDDGIVASLVTHVEPGLVRAEIKNDGVIGPRKGINLPQSVVSAPAVTDKDRADALFAVEQAVDVIALSFVRRPQDVLDLADILSTVGSRTPIIAKIEKPQALTNLRGILEVSWGVMVARGDLGVELSPEEVPVAQKRIIREAIDIGRPVITATQMLESMTRNPRPTRAEASDVANAVLDGTDAVMLSAETASGKYPVESVQMMHRIIETTERHHSPPPQARRRERGMDTTATAVIEAGCGIAQQLHAHALVAFSRRGRTAILCSQKRPVTPIIAFTPQPEVRDLLACVWGVQPHVIAAASTTEGIFEALDAALMRERLADRGHRLVVLMSSPTASLGPTNVMTVHHVGSTTGP